MTLPTEADAVDWRRVAEILAEQIRRGRSVAAAVAAMGSAAEAFPAAAAEYRAGVRLLVTPAQGAGA